MATLEIDDGWLPLPININALPHPLRRYIHDLEALADPAGIVLENALTRDSMRAAEAKIALMRAALEATKRDVETLGLVLPAIDKVDAALRME